VTISLSLFFFADDAANASRSRYQLLLDASRFADERGFAAVWTPERHFHHFGGAYPNPAVAGAAIAARTKRIGIRAGSVVAPLQDPLRIAEEWAVVDNLSGGRVGISFASGWNAVDFVLAPDSYESRRTLLFERIEQVRSLWRGEELERRDGRGRAVAVRSYPRPLQGELPVWVTSVGTPHTARLAGAIGARLLTHLTHQGASDLATRIADYRASYRNNGTRTEEGYVTLMVHTFVGADDEFVRERLRAPMHEYLRSSLDLRGTSAGQSVEDALGSPSANTEFLVERAFERYLADSALFGSPNTCAALLRKLESMGVDEVACLIDFGMDHDEIMSSLELLSSLIPLAPPSRERDNARI